LRTKKNYSAKAQTQTSNFSFFVEKPNKTGLFLYCCCNVPISNNKKKSASINCNFQQLNTWQIAVCTVDVYCKGLFFLTGFANKIKLEKDEGCW
jgi:hypothetical protein